MEEGELNMKSVYILLILIIAASTLGCVGNKPSGVTTTGTPTETIASPTGTPGSGAATTTPSGNDDLGTQSDINTIDSLANDSSTDIPLSDANI
jgi:hypothetical protein